MSPLQTHRPSTTVRVGDEVVVRFGTREIRAKVIEDLGGIGVDGRQLVRVRALEPTNGEFEEFEVAADELN
jgi:hypothetical protein